MNFKVFRTMASMGVMCAIAGTAFSAHAAGLSNRECHTQFEAARKAETLNGQNFKAFKAAHCATTAETTPANTASTAANTGTAATAPAATPAGSPTFPTAISQKYAKESAGKARMHTCLDQYNMNKATGANANLKWIQKGGGYYSLCNKHLKGAQ